MGMPRRGTGEAVIGVEVVVFRIVHMAGQRQHVFSLREDLEQAIAVEDVDGGFFGIALGMKRNVHRQNHQTVSGNAVQIVGEPLELPDTESAFVRAPAHRVGIVTAEARAAVIDGVEDYEVDLAVIERVVGGAEKTAEGLQ